MNRFGLLAAATFAVVGLAPVSSAQSGTLSECTNDHLVATYRGGDAAMSHVYGRIVLKNVSDQSCWVDRKSTRLNSSHANISYAVFCLKKKNITTSRTRCSLCLPSALHPASPTISPLRVTLSYLLPDG